MSILTLHNISKKFQSNVNIDGLSNKATLRRLSFSVFWALKNINMSVNKGEIVGIIGRNGSGKSTLLSIIAGSFAPTEGQIMAGGKISALLMLGAGFQDELTGKENVYLNGSLLGLDKRKIEDNFPSILEFSELGDFINVPIGNYSNGMKMRLAFSVAIHNDFDILITDEIISVGDIYFQKKCFDKMLEFKKQGKAMLIATQAMGIVRGFCDRAYFLEDGRIIFEGDVREAAEKYEMLLNKKKVLSEGARFDMVKETKRWATDVEDWGRKEGGTDALITRVDIVNMWGMRIDKVRPGEKICVKAYFCVKKKIDDCHFGVAFFREDGVYCYGPNTKFDGFPLSQLSEGEGIFELKIKEFLLMPGVYYASIAIWDKNEKSAYAYHICSYKIIVEGEASFGQLLFLPRNRRNKKDAVYPGSKDYPNLDFLAGKIETENTCDKISLESIRFLNEYGSEDAIFLTGREMRVKIDYTASEDLKKELWLWLGIYRTDGIYCYGSVRRIPAPVLNNCANSLVFIFPELRILPGGYVVSAGFWDSERKNFLMYTHGRHKFNMVSERHDHGTIYLSHSWSWRLPKEKRESYYEDKG